MAYPIAGPPSGGTSTPYARAIAPVGSPPTGVMTDGPLGFVGKDGDDVGGVVRPAVCERFPVPESLNEDRVLPVWEEEHNGAKPARRGVVSDVYCPACLVGRHEHAASVAQVWYVIARPMGGGDGHDAADEHQDRGECQDPYGTTAGHTFTPRLVVSRPSISCRCLCSH